MGYTKWRKRKELTLEQLWEVGIDKTDAETIGRETCVQVEDTKEISKLNLDSLTKAKEICAFVVHGSAYTEVFEGWVDGYGTFYCTEQELEKHI